MIDQLIGVDLTSAAGIHVFFGADLSGLSNGQIAEAVNMIGDGLVDYCNASNFYPGENAAPHITAADLDGLTPDQKAAFLGQIEFNFDAILNSLQNYNSSIMDAHSSYHDIADNAAQYTVYQAWAFYDRLSALNLAEATINHEINRISQENPNNAALVQQLVADLLVNNGFGGLVSGYNPAGVYNGVNVYGPSGSSGSDIVVIGTLNNFNSFEPVVQHVLPTFSYASYTITPAPPPPPPVDTDGDGVSDTADVDPNDPNVGTQEIVVNGIRQDVATRDEILKERYFLTTEQFYGHWVNAEQLPSGEWIIRQALNPTEDQLHFKHNIDLINSAFGVFYNPNGNLYPTISQSNRISLSSALTDKGIDLLTMNMNISQLYSNYQSLLRSGNVQGRNVLDFVDWIYNSLPPASRPAIRSVPSISPSSYLFEPDYTPPPGYTYTPPGNGGSGRGDYNLV